MAIIDRAIAALSPQWALKRQRARAAMGLLERSYDGAKTGRRTGGWVTAATSADSEISASLVKLRDRSRDIIRNNPYGQRALDIFSTNVVGTGLVAKAVGMQAEWEAWCKQCDADGLMDFYGIQGLVARTLFESGEVLVRFRTRRPEDGMIVPLALQVLEPDYLDGTRTGATAGGGWVKDGIEYGALGQRVAYWLWNQHPGDAGRIGRALESRRVPADEVLHIFERKRPGQNRGVPRLASALLKMRDLDDYEEAELVRKGIEACFSAFVTSEDENQIMGTAETREDGARIESLGAGMIQYLKPGQDITFGTPNNSAGYADYTRTQLRAIAAGIGLTYEQLTGDLSGVNYSSIRAGLVEFQRTVETVQWLVMVPMLLDPVWKRWSNLAYAVRAVKTKPPESIRWTPPKRQWVDPLKDVNAARNEIGAGITSISETIRARGEDPEKVFAEIAEERALMQSLGIVSDVIAVPAAAPMPPDPEEAAAKSAALDLVRAQTTHVLAEGRALLAAPAKDNALQAMAAEVRSAVQALAERKPADIHIHNAQPAVTLNQGEIRNEIHLPEQAAPVIEVKNEIHEREQPAPVINIAAPNVDVTVEAIMPDEVKTTIVSLPDRKTTTEIVRDSKGNIAQSTQTETDA